MINFFNEVLFSNDECDKILSFANGFVDLENYGFKLAIPEKRNSKYSEVVNIEDLEKLILPKLKEIGILSIKSGSMFIEYNEGDFFEKHIDNSYKSNRVCTVVIQLSNEDDYEGGDLIVEGIRCSRKRGTMIVFSGNDLHEVEKITKGTRRVFVCMPTKSDIKIKNSII